MCFNIIPTYWAIWCWVSTIKQEYTAYYKSHSQHYKVTETLLYNNLLYSCGKNIKLLNYFTIPNILHFTYPAITIFSIPLSLSFSRKSRSTLTPGMRISFGKNRFKHKSTFKLIVGKFLSTLKDI